MTVVSKEEILALWFRLGYIAQKVLVTLHWSGSGYKEEWREALEILESAQRTHEQIENSTFLDENTVTQKALCIHEAVRTALSSISKGDPSPAALNLSLQRAIVLVRSKAEPNPCSGSSQDFNREEIAFLRRFFTSLVRYTQTQISRAEI